MKAMVVHVAATRPNTVVAVKTMMSNEDVEIRRKIVLSLE